MAGETRIYRLLTIVSTAWLLVACGFQPLYGTPRSGDSVGRQLQSVYIAEIANLEVGQTLRNRLIDIMRAKQFAGNADYHLAIGLELAKEGLAIQSDDNVTRINLRMVARYQLLHRLSGNIATSGSVRTISSYNVIRSDYANLFSERDAVQRAAFRAAEEIRARVAVAMKIAGKPALSQ